MKKRIISLTLCLILLCLCVLPLASCSESSDSGVTKLYVYNWGEYISDGSEGSLDSNRAFEEWYFETYGERIEVVYSTFSSNEDMYAKLTAGAVSYDVIVPSDYMIARLASEGLLMELNVDNIPNYVYFASGSFATEGISLPFFYIIALFLPKE